ncbi:oligosaccharide flippase family protein [Bacillus cereus]
MNLIKNIGNKLRPYQVLNNTMIVFMGNIVAYGINFLTIVLLARYFGSSKLSLYTITTTLLTLLLAIADSGIANTLVKFINSKDQDENLKLRYFKAGLYLRICISILIFLFGLLCSDQLATYFNASGQLKDLFFMSFIGVLVLTVHGYISMKLQAEERFVDRSIFLTITAVIRFVPILVLLLLYPKYLNLESAVSIYIFTPIIVTIFYGKELFLILRTHVTIQELKRTFLEIYHYCKWLFLSMVAVLLIMRLDQFLLLKLGTVEEASIYSVATQFAMILPLLTDSLMTAMLPSITKKNQDLLEYRKKIIRSIIPVGTLIFILCIPLSFILTVIFGEEFQKSVPVFLIIVLGYIIGLLLNPLSLIFYSLSKVKYLTMLNYIQLLLIIVIDSLLIPRYGAIGAALGVVAVRVFALFYVGYITKRVIHHSKNMEKRNEYIS